MQYEESGKLFEAIRCYKRCSLRYIELNFVIFLFDRAERLVPNIELETFDYTGRNMKKKSPSVAKEEEAKVNVEDPKEVNEAELEGLCQKFSRMRSTEKSSLIQVKPTLSPKATIDIVKSVSLDGGQNGRSPLRRPSE